MTHRNDEYDRHSRIAGNAAAQRWRRRVEVLLYSDDGGDRRPLAAVLKGMALIYGGVQRMRRALYLRNVLASLRLPCRVISVGNLTLGGTGKTPMVCYLAAWLTATGQRVAVILRGYRGEAKGEALVVSDGRRVLLNVRQSGEEAQLIARRLSGVPVLIGKNRYRAGTLALERFQPDVVLLDDGFQHLGLQRDLDLVLMDAANPLGNGHVLPRGVLREPPAALAQADALIFTRAPSGRISARAQALLSDKRLPPNMPHFQCTHQPYFFTAPGGLQPTESTALPEVSGDLDFLGGARVIAFSGIVRNDDFRRVLLDRGADLQAVYAFGDHHPYAAAELESIAAAARDTAADYIVTTEKDFVRLPPATEWPVDLAVVGVKIEFGADEEKFRQFVTTRLAAASRKVPTR